jgi:hypothetical protein
MIRPIQTPTRQHHILLFLLMVAIGGGGGMVHMFNIDNAYVIGRRGVRFYGHAFLYR